MGNFCKYCGARVDGKTGLCPNCDAGQLRARRRQRNMIWIIAAVAVIAAALGAAAWYLLRTPDSGRQPVHDGLQDVPEAPEIQPEEPLEQDPAAVAGEPEKPEEPDPNRPMPVVEVDGLAYIGLLEIPALERTLPVLSEWSEANAKTAPCRYQGSLYQGDLIIAGHNYRSHFGPLQRLAPGDFVYFTDGEGEKYTFVVDTLETVPGTDFEGMESGEWDLTLFTCTWGGQSRLAVRCLEADSGQAEAG